MLLRKSSLSLVTNSPRGGRPPQMPCPSPCPTPASPSPALLARSYVMKTRSPLAYDMVREPKNQVEDYVDVEVAMGCYTTEICSVCARLPFVLLCSLPCTLTSFPQQNILPYHSPGRRTVCIKYHVSSATSSGYFLRLPKPEKGSKNRASTPPPNRSLAPSPLDPPVLFPSRTDALLPASPLCSVAGSPSRGISISPSRAHFSTSPTPRP